MAKTLQQINEKIGRGEAVVVTAEEMTEVVREQGASAAAEKVDVVTTGTFGPMCSSGALLNIGHTSPRINLSRAWLNGVPAYCGIAAVDLYLGATARREGNGASRTTDYGGGHVIEDLLRGREIALRAEGHGTDCYPLRHHEAVLTLAELRNATLMNPRNCYQNYNVAVNASSDSPVRTYMGTLLPEMENAAYCSAGQLSPLLNDPAYRTIGIGTRIFLGGGRGYVSFPGTQHSPEVSRSDKGVPVEGAGTLAVTGDLKTMSADFVRGVSIPGYGVSMALGLGIPIPVLDEQVAESTGVSDEDIVAPVVDYSRSYPDLSGEVLGTVSYARLRSGTIELEGREVRTVPLSSYQRAREVAEILKAWIERGDFLLSAPVEPLPGVSAG
ncbi:hypothetical protein GF402_08995 [Candidatus Fermentibacteria bacterium]|nr:hypothetical protein [Candidatus Fermentibacteria bacterium]